MSDKPTISVIIPVYNGERFLAEAIRSVLDQTLPPDEVIVVDDGSTDGSAALAGQVAGVLVLRQPNRGVAAALNLGISHARGDLLGFLDADDRWRPDKLERQVEVLRANPELDMVFGYAQQFYQDGKQGGEAEETMISSTMQAGISYCVMLIRREAFACVGAFVEDPGIHDFLDWYIRAQTARLRFSVLTGIVYERRVHAHNSGGGRSPEALRQSYLSTLRLAIRRRQTGGAST
jgi:glycosyltransferase involved in cell wall biosynthesis